MERNEHVARLLRGINGHVEQTLHLVQQKAVVAPIDPRNPEEFRLIFGDADKICAYNPPLTLLTLAGNPSFRQIIFNFLLRTEGTYRAIVGKEGVEKLAGLHNMWVNEQGGSKAAQALTKMRVTSYLHSAGLHTTQHPWPGFNEDDVRGLSFFLIETPQHRKVLLYILGKPFVNNFAVPDLGLLITEPEDDARIYDRLREAFENRWATLSECGCQPEVWNDLTLPNFYLEYQRAKRPA